MPDDTTYHEPTTPPEKNIGYISSIWAQQQRRYRTMWGLYDGSRWNEIEKGQTTGQNNEPVKRYRLEINDVAFACLTHAYTLFGEVSGDSDPLLRPVVEPKLKSKAVDVTEAQEFLDVVWADSNARQAQFTSAVTSQVTGGTFWRVRYNLYEPQHDLFSYHPFKFESIYPDYVFPVWATGSQEISEIYIRYRVNKDAAKVKWGVWSDKWPDTVEYEEHWSSETVHIMGDGTVVKVAGSIEIRIGSGNDWRTVQRENNPFGIVPFVYIPHVPDRGFFGLPLPEWTQGLVDEYNARFANLGDLTKQAALRIGKVKGVSGDRLKVVPLWPGGPPVVHLGMGNPDGIEPSLEFEDPPAITPALVDFVRELERKSRDSMFVPPVAIGQDEGSQRSALTLSFRMWPLQSHVSTERWLWATGQERLNKIALHMAKVKNIIKTDVRNIRVISDWSPMLPRDREQLVNEMVLRDQAGHVLPEDALLAYGDTRRAEIEEKVGLLKQYVEWREEVKAPPEPFGASGGSNGSDPAKKEEAR